MIDCEGGCYPANTSKKATELVAWLIYYLKWQLALNLNDPPFPPDGSLVPVVALNSQVKLNKWPPLCTCRLKWARRTLPPEDGEMNEMTLPSRIRNSSPGGLRPSTLPLGHGGSPAILNLYEWAGKKYFVSLKLEGQNPRSPTFHAGSINHCTRAPATRGKATERISYFNMTHLLLKLTNGFEYKCSQPRWLNRSGRGSKLRGTGFDSTLGRIFFIGFVHIQCSKLFKGMKCTVLSMVLCTIKKPWSHSIRVGHSPDFGLLSVAILPWLCRKRREAILLTHSWI